MILKCVDEFPDFGGNTENNEKIPDNDTRYNEYY